jgi:sodium-independent sulfate anion transporter 11
MNGTLKFDLAQQVLISVISAEIDLIACLVTFLASIILGMEYGIIIGVAISIGAILMKSLKPKVSEEMKTEETCSLKYFLITPESGLLFPSVDFVRTRINKLSLKYKSVKYFFINFEKWTQVDYTAATSLVSLLKGFENNGKAVRFINCSERWVQVLQDAGCSKPPVIAWNDVTEFIKKANASTVTLNVQSVEMTDIPSSKLEPSATVLSPILNGNEALLENSNSI